jgi:hypothetical protein
MTNFKMNGLERKAMERLIGHASRTTGQSRRVADFLLAWWNGESCSGFDIADAWGCDYDIKEDMIIVFGLAVRSRVYPDDLGYNENFVKLVKYWRPSLVVE